MNMREILDISAYLVVGPENTLERPVRDVVSDAVRAGFTCVQIRSKEASARELILLLKEAADVIAALGKSDSVTLLINDRLDVALAAREMGIKVDGIHVGQSDIPVSVCRKYLGEQAVIGLSAKTNQLIDYVKSADTSEIDYFGSAPLHATDTKPECGRDKEGKVETRSLAELRDLVACSSVPVVIGGGVKKADLAELFATGVNGFFVVSAVASAEAPYEAAKEMVQEWKQQSKKC